MSQQYVNRYGNPFKDDKIDREWLKNFEATQMVHWDIPNEINKAIPPLPNKVYVNKLMVVPLENVFRNLIDKNLHGEIKTWDGCFNVRRMRGSKSVSVHAYGLAVDLNAAWNPLKDVGVLDRNALRKVFCQWTEAFLDVWRVDFECGADWQKRMDAMHFQLKL